MANTWQSALTKWLPATFQQTVKSELSYRIERKGGEITYSVDDDAGRSIQLPISALVGGERHGIGFLISMREVEGVRLARPVLLQGRYSWSADQKRLLLAPGCKTSAPETLEEALGLTLSPTFEERCLACHGQPASAANGAQGGVRCESCHGPGSEHIAAVKRGSAVGLNSKHLSAQAAMGICAQCHVGLARFSDPSPQDLLIANQVRSLTSSECYLQSGKTLTCTTCHDPHGQAAEDKARSEKACLGCHSAEVARHAAICPVRSNGGCVGCHMPGVELGALHLVDHWIRVHPEQKATSTNRSREGTSRVRPVSEYLRMIATTSKETADGAQRRLESGENFYPVARETSMDRSAAIGGYLGRKTLSELSREEADEAAALPYGQASKPFASDGKWIILQRLPRDFRWDAQQLEIEAEARAAEGNAVAAISGAQESLKIYPHYLRALTLIGTTFAANGNLKKAAAVMETAGRLYPEDAKTQLALGVLYWQMGEQAAAQAADEKAIALEPDFTAAYQQLGKLLCDAGHWTEAIQTLQSGIQIDPLSATLHEELAEAWRGAGRFEEAAQTESLARKLRWAPRK